MLGGKPVIGICGGIGSGKSHVARAFGDLGCLVINSDALVHEAYRDASLRATLAGWWGPGVLLTDGSVDRAFIGEKIFRHPEERERLESLVHPIVEQRRHEMMAAARGNSDVKAIVLDTPLLLEKGLGSECDKIVFVDAPRVLRLARVKSRRGWSDQDLAERENLQMPLDKKRAIADYTVANTTGADIGGQVTQLLSQILAELSG